MTTSSAIEKAAGVGLAMLVDDDPMILALEKHLLEKDGWNIVEADNGEAAVSLYRQHRPQIVLMDALMEGMDGFEACRRIVELDQTGQTTVLMVTSLGDELSLEQAYAAGAEDYITKPLNLAVLRKRVQHLAQAQQAEQRRQQAEEQLRQSVRLQAISRIAGGIAHDFNNILASMLGFAELALEKLATQDQGGDAKVSRYLQEVVGSGQRAKQLIDEMMAVTRDDSSDRQLLSPQGLVEDILTVLHTILPANIRVKKELEEGLPLIRVEPAGFNQALMRVCLHARDEMAEGGCLTLRLKTVSGLGSACVACHEKLDGRFLVVTVTDDTGGIRPEALQLMLGSADGGKEGVTGVSQDLSMVPWFLHESGGHVQVHAAPDQPVEIQFLYPVAEQ